MTPLFCRMSDAETLFGMSRAVMETWAGFVTAIEG